MMKFPCTASWLGKVKSPALNVPALMLLAGCPGLVASASAGMRRSSAVRRRVFCGFMGCLPPFFVLFVGVGCRWFAGLFRVVVLFL